MSGPFGSQHWMYGGGFYDHTIDQSLRCNGSNEYLTRTPSSSGNRRTWTFSAWVKLGVDGVRFPLIEAYSNGTNFTMVVIHTDGRIQFYTVTSAVDYGGLTTQKLRDPSAWYHIVFRFDSTQSTAADRSRLYVNGTQQETNPWTSSGQMPQNYDSFINHTVANNILKNTNSSQYGQGYIAEVHHADGASYGPETFGETKNGVWVPKEVSGVSYGTNGFYLNFADSSDIGNNVNSIDGTNDFTVNNFTAIDVVPDSPTKNFATLIPMTNIALSEGNLKMTTSRTGKWDGTIGSFGVTSGKWYYEVRPTVTTDSTFRCVAGWQGNQASQTVTYNGKGASGSPYGTLTDNYLVNVFTTSFYKDGGTDGTMTAASSGDVINVAADFDNGKIYFGINGTYYANDGGTDGNPGAGTNESLSGIDLTAKEYVPAFNIRSDNSTGGNQMIVNFGQEGTFAGTETAGGNSDANGVGNFFSAVPSGFLALASSNLEDSTIGPNSDTNSGDNFNTVLYTGNGGTLNVTGVGFQPDWVWLKSRAATRRHMLYDVVRGTTKAIRPSLTNAQITGATTLTSFDNDGFSLGADSDVNTNAEAFVSWNWKAGGSPSSNSDGSVSSTVSANTVAGFSIVQYEGLSSGTQTVGHGLNSAPEYIIFKNIDDTSSWVVYSEPVGTGGFLLTNSTNGTNTSDVANTFNSTAPTNSVFTVGTNNAVGGNGETIIAYCFHSVEGYSKIGTFRGNSSSDGTFVFLGFRPARVFIKSTSSGTSWCIFDNKREGYNVDNDLLRIGNVTEQTDDDVDFVSNGLKFRRSSTNFNNSSHTYLYIAFAEAPFKYANAR